MADAIALLEKSAEAPAPGRGMRQLSVHSVFPDDLPISREEIHKVLAAFGPELAAPFEEDG